MPECAKTHPQQSRISKFSGGGPPDPLFKGREGREREGRRGQGKGREGGRGRIGKGGEGRQGTWEGRNGGREGRGGALDMGSAPLPPETSSGSAPAVGYFNISFVVRLLLRSPPSLHTSFQSSVSASFDSDVHLSADPQFALRQR